ncbi:hypothetical protein CDD83_7734 [Cordyceps sp. RAO-2017]|nr:hypothetical protein CDD83_7734 [Cordyceps sp. RAO-2017]
MLRTRAKLLQVYTYTLVCGAAGYYRRTYDEHAMHLDATALWLREDCFVYNQDHITEDAATVRRPVYNGWELHAYPVTASRRGQSTAVCMLTVTRSEHLKPG